MPPTPKPPEVEITQLHDLDIERRAVGQGGTDLYARHQADVRLEWREVPLTAFPDAMR
jgi:hypothetical protein